MKNLLFGLFLILFACGQKQVKSDSIVNKYIGTYEYIYSDNTPDLIENHYIILTKNDNKLEGLYYGTSDEFDNARAGYFPGFFVSTMDNLEIVGDTIRFTLNTTNNDFLTQAVDLKIKSTKEAINLGYKNWDVKIPTTPKDYIGLIQDSATIFFKADKEYLNKTFKKIK